MRVQSELALVVRPVEVYSMIGRVGRVLLSVYDALLTRPWEMLLRKALGLDGLDDH